MGQCETLETLLGKIYINGTNNDTMQTQTIGGTKYHI